MRKEFANRGVFVGRFLKIAFYLDYTWFPLAAFLAYTLGAQYFPEQVKHLSQTAYLIMGVTAAMLFFISVLLHELGHSVVSQRLGIPVPRITLTFIGGIAEIAREPDEAIVELKIALGGPVVSLVLGFLFLGIAHLAETMGIRTAFVVAQWLAITNFVLLVFNMLPGYPFDGGRVLRALIWAKTGRLRHATWIASRFGIALSWLLFLWGLFVVLIAQQWNGLIMLFISTFLRNAAEQGYEHALHREVLADVTVGDIMTPSPIRVLGSNSVNQVVEDYFRKVHHRAYPVCDPDGLFLGVLHLQQIRKVPKEKWPYVTAADLVAENGGGEHVKVRKDEPAISALRTLARAEHGRLAVIEGDQLVGMVTRHDLVRFIEVRDQLGV